MARLLAPSRLFFSSLLAHKVRTILASLAVALAVSLVVSVTTGYATIEAVARQLFTQVSGSTDAMIVRRGRQPAGVDQRFVAQAAEDPDVASAVGRLEISSKILDQRNQVIPNRQAELIGIQLPNDQEIERLRVTQGGWFNSDAGNVAVVDQVIAELLKLKAGDTFTLPGTKGAADFTVAGVVHKPGFFAQFRPTIYLPLQTLQDLIMPDQPRRITRVLIDLNPGTDEKAFAARWEDLKQREQGLEMRLATANREKMDEHLRGAQLMSYLGSTVAVIAAGFIVLSALLMGLTERQRTLAMLRAIGASRPQIASVVVGEGLVLAIIGLAIGIPLGWLWIKCLVNIAAFQDLFESVGVVIDRTGILLAIGGGLASALLGSALPAWHASRVDPLEAMTPLARPSRRKLPVRAAIVGLVLASIDSLLFFGPVEQIVRMLGVENVHEATRAVRFFGHYSIGLLGLLVGFFLMAPIIVWICERTIGRAVSRAMGVRYELLRQQLSGGLWRAAGTAGALMVGLALLVGLQIHGNTLLGGWRLPTRFPDVFIVSPVPIDDAQVQKIRSSPLVVQDHVMPVAVASPQFGTSIFGIMMGAQIMPDATMFFGVDPDLAVEMLELEFRDEQGKAFPPDMQATIAREAMDKLKLGRHAIVTDEYRQLRNLHVGDKLPLKTIRSGTVDYTIAGVVWSPGLDVITSRFDLGTQVEQRTAASVFGAIDDARNDFGVQGVYMIAANVKLSVERAQVVTALEQELGRSNLTVIDIRQLKYDIEQGLRRLLLLASCVAFAAMGVAALGMINTIMASVRSRRWQLGLLRSIGLTRGQLVRLILAEALVLGAVACLLGLVAGFTLATNARGLNATLIGYTPPMVVPWDYIGLGCGIVLLVSLLASAWPAITTSREQPLTLLAAGRAAA